MNGVTYGSGNSAPLTVIRRDCMLSREISGQRHRADRARLEGRRERLQQAAFGVAGSIVVVFFINLLPIAFG